MLNVAEYLPRDLKKRGVEFAIQECVYQKKKKKKLKHGNVFFYGVQKMRVAFLLSKSGLSLSLSLGKMVSGVIFMRGERERERINGFLLLSAGMKVKFEKNNKKEIK